MKIGLDMGSTLHEPSIAFEPKYAYF